MKNISIPYEVFGLNKMEHYKQLNLNNKAEEKTKKERNKEKNSKKEKKILKILKLSFLPNHGLPLNLTQILNKISNNFRPFWNNN